MLFLTSLKSDNIIILRICGDNSTLDLSHQVLQSSIHYNFLMNLMLVTHCQLP